ncbi:T9SS type A sorting domain-containing protein [Psychroserpens sp. SPM9]|uniref:T9SS type A sorting domain-containing protein n=1 Tax=Psychroserpens sp. SPM9 TaxID=2975598 RepID=UPI0021A39F33|nr:T9SS type A sorting domain-containing protein [Psychroserpens sp. SPM9]MDG5492119.1 T9SS type A sorting domain-containing protein [Psychroserpens sp. SPM9]
MRKKYLFCSLIVIFCFGLSFQKLHAQFKIVEVNPATETVKIKNFGSTTLDISSYRLCSLFKYGTLSNMTVLSGSLNLAPDAEVEVVVSLTGGAVLNDSAADLGLYIATGNFGSDTSMVDFVQWGSSPNGRESVAVTKGIWTAGTFVNVSPPYEFTGGASDTGVTFWDTLLSVENPSDINKFSISPNPASLYLNVEIPNTIENATLRVYDLLGKKILDIEMNGVQYKSINVSKWNSGIYMVRVSSDDLTQTKRFIKQ